MNNGECYVYYSHDIIYSFPELTCVQDSPLPSFDSSTRHVYFLDNFGDVRLVISDHVSSTYLTQEYVAHVFNGEYLGDTSIFVLPATLFLICFLAIIYRWFFRLRG